MKDLLKNRIVLSFIILFIAISIIPSFEQDIFVLPTGNIKIIGLAISVIISYLIAIRWKYIQLVFTLLMIIVIITDLQIIIHTEGQLAKSLMILMLGHLILLLFFHFSKSISSYLSKGKNL